MNAEEVFAAGYAVPAHDIDNGVRHWRYRAEEFTLPWNAVQLRYIEGFKYQVGKIEDVRAAAELFANLTRPANSV